MIRRIGIILLFGNLGCNQIDQDKFEKLYRAGLEAESASSSFERSAATHNLGIEMAVAQNKVTSVSEKKLIGLYSDAFSALISDSGDFQSWEALRKANRCYSSAGRDCAEPLDLAAKAAEAIAREYEAKQDGRK